jgi:hypothetical protein
MALMFSSFLIEAEYPSAVYSCVERFGETIVRIKARGDNAFKCNMHAVIKSAAELSECLVNEAFPSTTIDAMLCLPPDARLPSHLAGLEFCEKTGVAPAFLDGMFDQVLMLSGHKVVVALKRQVGTEVNTDAPGAIAEPGASTHYLWPTTWARTAAPIEFSGRRLHAEVTETFYSEAVPLLFGVATALACRRVSVASLTRAVDAHVESIRHSKEKQTSDQHMRMRVIHGTLGVHLPIGEWFRLYRAHTGDLRAAGAIVMPFSIGPMRLLAKRRTDMLHAGVPGVGEENLVADELDLAADAAVARARVVAI